MGVHSLDCPDVGISDINHFVYDSQDLYGVRLMYGISATADSTDQAGIYIADNPMGPARLIPGSVRVPIRDDLSTPGVWEENYYTDSRSPYADTYWYFLNHGPGPLNGVMKPSDLFPLEGDSVSWDYWCYYSEDSTYCQRPEFDPPSGVTATDVPLDFGGALTLEWDLSTDDELIDYYNVYREMSMGGYSAGYEHLVSLPPGTSSYLDTLVAQSVVYRYRVSSAHHGPTGTGSGENYGLWNDFSVPSVPTSPIDNLEDIAIALGSADTLVVCPQGDHDSLSVLVTVHGSDGSPTAGIPAGEILFLVSKSGAGICGDDTLAIHLCDGDTLGAVRETDAGGETELVYSAIGGCGTLAVTAQVMEKPVFDTLTVVIRSPDFDGDGVIELGDLARLASAFPSGCGNGNYCTCVDLNLDCAINLGDLAILGSHYCPSTCFAHECGAGSAAMVAERSQTYAPQSPNGLPGSTPVFEVKGVKERVLEDGRLTIPIRIQNVSSLLGCHVVIQYEGQIQSAEFVPTDYLHDPVVIPARVDEEKKIVMVAFAASMGVVTREAEGLVGSLVVEGTVLPHSLKVVEATILDGDWRLVPVVTDDQEETIAGGSIVGENAAGEIAETALYQSVPNPANPATAISFSLKERSHVTLRIFRVNGELVRTLVDDVLDTRLHKVLWDGKDEGGRKVSSGVYFCRLEAGSLVDQKKLVILK